MDIGKIDICVPTRSKLPEWWYTNLERIPCNKLLVDSSKPLAYSRSNLIKRVETPWFAFIDDDVIIGQEWYKTVTSFITNKTGVIDGRDIYPIPKKHGELVKSLNYLRVSKPNVYLKLGERGRTVCSLFKTSVVKDWKPCNNNLVSWEDYDLTQHVIRKGYTWFDVLVPATHYRGWTLRDIPKKGLWHGKGVKQIRPTKESNYYIPLYLRNLLGYPIVNMFKAIFRQQPKSSCNIQVAAWICWQNYWLLIGIIMP